MARLYKDGINAAFRTAKAAAVTAVCEGISAEDFRRHYGPTCRSIAWDNLFSKILFLVTTQIQKRPFARRGLLRMTRAEQSRPHEQAVMSRVLWDMFTGSASYRHVFLRTLSVERLGGARAIPVDVRVITGSKRSLKEIVAEGRFRDHLFYRRNVIPINLPPLRERREDVPILMDHFIKRYFRQRSDEPRQIAPAVLQAFMRYPWPGNVRELENACERIAQTCTCDTIRVGCVPVSVLFHKYAEDQEPIVETHDHPSSSIARRPLAGG